MHGLSLIVPIYNVEIYIEECLQSIIESMEDREDIQVILVDDGSTDQSGEIAKKYSAVHSNFLYSHKENGGLSDARNHGLNHVRFDYVSFVDSDDKIDKTYFRKVFEALEDKPDMVIFDWVDISADRRPVVVKGMDFSEVLWTVQPSACNKAYKSSLFDKIKFPVGKVYEDVGTTYKLLYYVQNYTYIDAPLYQYRKNREGSILTTVSSKINDLYSALDDIYNFYRGKNALSGDNKEGLCYQHVKLLIWSNMYRQLKFYRLNLWGFYKKMKLTRELLYQRFPDWKQNNHLVRNVSYFESRLGNKYVAQLDFIGESPFTTLKTIGYAAVKNRKRS